jgi:shikimate dehydrogenase
MTYHFGLTGYPLGHSLSPKIHTAALQSCGLNGDYSLFPISPNDLPQLQILLHCLRSGELHGLNVTIPHKQSVIPYLDDLTPSARAIGAVNTIYVKDGKLIGHNTDAPGFLADLARCFSSFFILHSALILGAGGAARAVVAALLSDGWQVKLAVRQPDLGQAQELSLHHSSVISFCTFDEISALDLSQFGLIVNTTPLGMSPNVDTCAWPDGLGFPTKAVAYDCVYNPRETVFTRRARAAGLPASTGLGMLVEQAALAFETWTDRNIPRDVLFEAVNETRNP